LAFRFFVKAASGGGGRGMKSRAQTLMILQSQSRQRARKRKPLFGDDTVYLEKYLEKPRHIEIQIFGDGKGQADFVLGERDCLDNADIKKIFEESPSPALNDTQRQKIGDICAKGNAKNRNMLAAERSNFFMRMANFISHRNEHAYSGRASCHGSNYQALTSVL